MNDMTWLEASGSECAIKGKVTLTKNFDLFLLIDSSNAYVWTDSGVVDLSDYIYVTIEPHEHTLTDEYIDNGNGTHSQYCSGCEEYIVMGAHVDDGTGKCALCGAAMGTAAQDDDGDNGQGTGTGGGTGGNTQSTTQDGTTQKTEETVKPTEKPVENNEDEVVETPEATPVPTTEPDTDIDPTASVMSEGNVWLVAAIGGAALAAAAVSVFLVKEKRAVR